MKVFEIWSEGFLVSGMEGKPAPAQHIGEHEGESFEDACVRFAESDQGFAGLFNRERMTHWGCRLYDNEADAKASFS